MCARTNTRRARTWARSLTPCGPRGHAHTHTLARRYGQQHAAQRRARVCPGARRRYAAELAHGSCGYGAYGWRRRCSRSDSEGALARDIDSGSAPTGPVRRAFAVWRPLRFQLRASHARCVVDVAQRWGRPSRAVRRRACGQRGRRRGTRPGARASPSAHLSLALSARLFATREPRLRPQQPPRRHGSLCSSAPTAPRR